MADPARGPGLRSQEEIWITRCIELAKRGAGAVSPNPMVGAVIIRDGNIIAEGWHERFGGPHAEVNAIRNLLACAGDPRGAILAVNLEPCNYHGKTPPCTNLLIESGISRVIVGMLDPNPKVSGNGIRQLNAAGIQTASGVLEPECKSLNAAFEKFIRTGLPLVVLKSAQSLDGRITSTPGAPSEVTGAVALKHSHVMRNTIDAILVGAGTVRSDNPELTVRLVNGRNPVRIILSSNGNLDPASRVFDRAKTERVMLFTAPSDSGHCDERSLALIAARGVDVRRVNLLNGGQLDLPAMLTALAGENIASLLIEGGAQTVGAFLSQKLADRLTLYIAPKIFGVGTRGFPDEQFPNSFQLANVQSTRLDNDVVIEGDIIYPYT